MSGDFGFFEVLASSPDAEQEARCEASDRLAAATYDVREQFGDFLFQARSVREYRDRCALVKDDAIRLVGNHLMPITGVMRRIGLTGRGGQLEKEFRNRLAGEVNDAYESGEANDGCAGPGKCMDDLCDHRHAGRRQTAEGPHEEGYAEGTSDAGRGKFNLQNHPRSSESDFAEGYYKGYDSWDDPHGQKRGRRRRADMTGPEMHNDETFQDHQGEELIPEGDFHGYLDDVDQGAPSKEDHNFVGEGHDHTGDPADTDFVSREGAWGDGPTGFQDPGSMPASALGPPDEHDSPEYHEQQAKPDPHAGWMRDETGRMVQPAGGSDPYARHQEPGQKYSPLSSKVVQQYVAFCRRNKVPLTITALERHGKRLSSNDYLTIAAGLQRLAADALQGPSPGTPAAGVPNETPQGQMGVADSIGNVSEQITPTARRRREEGVGGPHPGEGIYGARYAHGYLSWCRQHHLAVASVDNLRSYGRHTARVNPEGYRYVAGQLRRAITSARARYAAPDYLNKANEALTNLLNQRAEEFQETIAPLQQALQVVQQAEQLQQAANPMGVQPPAGTVNVLPEQQGMPGDVGGGAPPGGDPSGGGGEGGDPAAAAMALAGGGGAPPPDPSQQMAASRRRRAAGEYPAEDPAEHYADWLQFQGLEHHPKHLQNYAHETAATPDEMARIKQVHGGRKRGGQGKAVGATRPRTGAGVVDLWNKWSQDPSNTTIGSEDDVSNFATQHGIGERGKSQLRQHLWGQGGQLATGVRKVEGRRRARRAAGPPKTGGYFWRNKELTPENADRFLKAKDNTVVVTMTHPDGSSKDLTWKDVHDQGGNYLGLPKHSKRTQFKVAWVGWGPALENRGNPRVAGWDWDNHLLAYTSNAPREFTCSCGETHEIPGYHTCRCGKIWNGYVIGSGGDTHEASAEKFLVREIPVRPDVIVANRRALHETPIHHNQLQDAETSQLIELHHRGNDPKHGDIGRELGYRATHDDDDLAVRYLQHAARLLASAQREWEAALDDEEDNVPFPSDHKPKVPEIGATPDDWHSRSPKGQWTRGQAPRRKQPART